MDKQVKWYAADGPESDVVISTRIRLARNLKQYPFPVCMTEEQRQQVCQAVKQVVQSSTLPVGKFNYLDMSKVPHLHAVSMVERHIISPNFANGAVGTGLALTQDESVGLMINEEDHIRIQVMRPGMMLDQAYDIADQVDTLLDKELSFAFDKRLGYLTQCPTNLGTGMRASLMLHLPALEEKGVLHQLSKTVSKLGLTIRGLYGEGSGSKGAVYQLSNQVTLGIGERAAMDNLKGIAEQIIREERQARKTMSENILFQDRVWRSLGILSHARTLTGEEGMNLLSNLLVGTSTGLLKEPSVSTIHELMNTIQPATLTVTYSIENNAETRDITRAALVRHQLGKEE